MADDGSYLSIDTNPDDEEEVFISDAWSAIVEINRELNIPESIDEDMLHTTFNDGKQTEEFKNISVSWKYHPNKGIEVIYKKTK